MPPEPRVRRRGPSAPEEHNRISPATGETSGTGSLRQPTAPALRESARGRFWAPWAGLSSWQTAPIAPAQWRPLETCSTRVVGGHRLRLRGGRPLEGARLPAADSSPPGLYPQLVGRKFEGAAPGTCAAPRNSLCQATVAKGLKELLSWNASGTLYGEQARAVVLTLWVPTLQGLHIRYLVSQNCAYLKDTHIHHAMFESSTRSAGNA
ncbi:uncharacterized protein LOC119825991 [Arvicola amphibius]|uniref:uncharacterized protein LOC119825991 n=1 Tax=Arvicola amphibius TaxID=1047088 RepID=UPI0018E2E722|nr:uncharacterized protein LOC119825991 [Arvicola amphibius]